MSTVLIVQADPVISDGWSLALESSGHTVLAAGAASQGLERVREGGIDLIVIDGAAEGQDLGHFVAELERLPDAPPFVLVSSSPAAPEISARLGAAAFVPKPCTNAEIDHLITRLSS